MTAPEPETRVRFVDMVAFACELALFVLLIAAVNRLVEGWRSWLIGIALALLVAVVWARWIAPSSERRLGDPERYVVQGSLVVAVAVLLALAGLQWIGVVFAALTLAVFALTRSERAV